MDERRRIARGRALIGAKVIFNNRKASLSCVVRNITADGCMLVFGEDPFIPNLVEVEIDNRMGLTPAEVVWRDGKKIGVAFRPEKA